MQGCLASGASDAGTQQHIKHYNVLTSTVHAGKAVQQVLARHAHVREADGAIVHTVQADLRKRHTVGSDIARCPSLPQLSAA